ncbi:MAG: DoxX family protein [Acidobacteriia bacterium]|nr:DoxX family protein [Terriglobia bacterium]
MRRFKKVLLLLGRILFASIFVLASPRHFTAEGVSHAAELGVPLARVLVPLSGLLAMVGGLSVATGFYAKKGAWALVLFLIPVTLGMHQCWNITESGPRHIQQSMFIENVSMLGGALIVASYGSGPFSVRGE